jgi:hypothetical protein
MGFWIAVCCFFLVKLVIGIFGLSFEMGSWDLLVRKQVAKNFHKGSNTRCRFSGHEVAWRTKLHGGSDRPRFLVMLRAWKVTVHVIPAKVRLKCRCSSAAQPKQFRWFLGWTRAMSHWNVGLDTFDRPSRECQGVKKCGPHSSARTKKTQWKSPQEQAQIHEFSLYLQFGHPGCLTWMTKI